MKRIGLQNKSDPTKRKARAKRIHDHYRTIELGMIAQLEERHYMDMELIRAIAPVQRRRAFAARILDIGLY